MEDSNFEFGSHENNQTFSDFRDISQEKNMQDNLGYYYMKYSKTNKKYDTKNYQWPPEEFFIKDEEIRQIMFSPCGKKFIATNGSSIDVWNLIKNKIEHSLKLHQSPIKCFSLSPSGKYLATISSDPSIKIINLQDYKLELTLEFKSESINQILYTFDGNHLVGCDESMITIWSIKELRELTSINPNSGKITCLSLSQDNKTLATGSENSNIYIWNIKNNFKHLGLLKEIKNNERVSITPQSLSESVIEGEYMKSGVTCIDFFPSKAALAAGYQDSFVKIWNIRSGTCISSLSVNGKINCLLFRPNESCLAIGSSSSIKIWFIDRDHNFDLFENNTENIFHVHRV